MLLRSLSEPNSSAIRSAVEFALKRPGPEEMNRCMRYRNVLTPPAGHGWLSGQDSMLRRTHAAFGVLFNDDVSCMDATVRARFITNTGSGGGLLHKHRGMSRVRSEARSRPHMSVDMPIQSRSA